MSYHVFVQTWWRENPAWPNGLEPHAGRKTTLQRALAREDLARFVVQWYNDNFAPGRLSRKAEYEEN